MNWRRSNRQSPLSNLQPHLKNGASSSTNIFSEKPALPIAISIRPNLSQGLNRSRGSGLRIGSGVSLTIVALFPMLRTEASLERLKADNLHKDRRTPVRRLMSALAVSCSKTCVLAKRKVGPKRSTFTIAQYSTISPPGRFQHTLEKRGFEFFNRIAELPSITEIFFRLQATLKHLRPKPWRAVPARQWRYW